MPTATRPHLNHRAAARALSALGGLAAALLPLAASALTIVGGLQQITSGDRNSFGASLSADGSRLAFYSASDLTGNNADRSFEVFTYERGSNQLQQVTSFAGGNTAGGNENVQISGDGSRLVYQEFTVDSTSTVFTRTVTRNFDTHLLSAVSSFGSVIERAVIDHDGSRIALQTANIGVRLFDTPPTTLGGVIDPGNGTTLSISGDGSRLVRGRFDGAVDLIDLNTNTSTRVVPSSGVGNDARPSLSGDGRYLAFTSKFNPLGSNADGNAELFVLDLQTNQLRQLTQSLSGYSEGASISADGSRVAFSSTSDLEGGNAEGNLEVFVFDLLEDSLLQVTDRPGGPFESSFQAELSADGLTVAFASFANLVPGDRGSGSDIFLASLSPQQHNPVPLPGTAWLLLLALLPIAGRARTPSAAISRRSPLAVTAPRCINI